MKKTIYTLLLFCFVINSYAQSPTEKLQEKIGGKWKQVMTNKPDFVPDVFIELSNIIEKPTPKEAQYKIFAVNCLYYDFEMKKSIIGVNTDGVISIGFVQEDYDPVKKKTNYTNYQGVIIGKKMYVIRYDSEDSSVMASEYDKVD